MNDFLPSATQPGLVLAVDFDVAQGTALALQLERYHFSVTRAVSLDEASQICEAVSFEAIFSGKSDLSEECREFCRHLSGTLNALTPILVLAPPDADEDLIAQVLEAGALYCIPGPISLPLIIAQLRAMVRLSRQHAARPATARQKALLEVAGGAAHELSQPLASARLLLDILERQKEHPTDAQMSQLRDFVQRTASILDQLRNLRVYVTKPYAAGGSILDLEQSRKVSGDHESQRSTKRKGSE